jgi:hypothetical protein
VSASRHVQDLDPVAVPGTGAVASVPAVEAEASRLAPFPVARPRTSLRAALETLPEREPTFDELLHGEGEHTRGARRPWSGMFGHRRAARARGPR